MGIRPVNHRATLNCGRAATQSSTEAEKTKLVVNHRGLAVRVCMVVWIRAFNYSATDNLINGELYPSDSCSASLRSLLEFLLRPVNDLSIGYSQYRMRVD